MPTLPHEVIIDLKAEGQRIAVSVLDIVGVTMCFDTTPIQLLQRAPQLPNPQIQMQTNVQMRIQQQITGRQPYHMPSSSQASGSSGGASSAAQGSASGSTPRPQKHKRQTRF